MIRAFTIGCLLAVIAPSAAAAQPRLTLTDAVARARAQNPDAGSAAAAAREAEQRVVQARAGYLPRVDLTESWQRGNQPVFVFSSLLSQRRFTAADFVLPALNHPDAVDNFRAALIGEQTVFDGEVRAGVAAAGVGRDIAAIRTTIVDRDLAVGVTRAYGRVLSAVAALHSSDAAIEAARADRERAANRRDAGLATDADVLQLDVYVARTRERQIRAASDERTARAELNQLMGEPLDAIFALDPAVLSAPLDTSNLAAFEAEALENRPDVRLAALEERLGTVNLDAAHDAFLPQVVAHGGWEWNGGAWNTRASSWVVGAVARLNLFQGFAHKARLAEAREQVTRRALERRKTETSVRLDVYLAAARLDAARASEAAGRAAVSQAQESRRIVRDRYDAGLADGAALLRATEAVLEAESLQTAAGIAVLTETAALERALGRQP